MLDYGVVSAHLHMSLSICGIFGAQMLETLECTGKAFSTTACFIG